MRRPLLAGAAAIVVAALAAAAAVDYLTGRGSAPREGGGRAAVGPAPGAPQAAEAAAFRPPPAPLPAPAPAVAAAPPAVSPAPHERVAPVSSAVPWERVPLAVRVTQLGTLAPMVHAGLQEARDAMEPCFDAEARRPAPPSSADRPPQGSPALVLSLEARGGTLEVVRTEIGSLGNATPALVACCREVLAGWSFAAPDAAEGSRYRLSWVVQ